MVDSKSSEMHDSERMLEARMPGARPDPRDETELLDPLESNEGGCADEGDIRPTQGNPVVQSIANGRCDREPGGRSSPWLGHAGKDRPVWHAVSAPARRHVCSAPLEGEGERG